jgi:hypothetical protein
MTRAAQRNVTKSGPAAVRHDPPALHDEDDPGGSRHSSGSASGSPETAMRSACLPASRVPTWSARPSSFAASLVDAWIARNGPRPNSDM